MLVCFLKFRFVFKDNMRFNFVLANRAFMSLIMSVATNGANKRSRLLKESSQAIMLRLGYRNGGKNVRAGVKIAKSMYIYIGNLIELSTRFKSIIIDRLIERKMELKKKVKKY